MQIFFKDDSVLVIAYFFNENHMKNLEGAGMFLDKAEKKAFVTNHAPELVGVLKNMEVMAANRAAGATKEREGVNVLIEGLVKKFWTH